MKSRLLIAVCMGVLIIGCQKDNQNVTPTTTKTSSESGLDPNSNQRSDLSSLARYSTSWAHNPGASRGSEFIPVIEANAMIGSYLYSIDAVHNDSDIRSFSVDADMLRAYLADSSVKNVKLVFAHTLDYMNSGHKGHHAGYQSGALTIIIAGYDEKGKYIFHDGKVLDHMTPCPYACPSGAAGSDFLY